MERKYTNHKTNTCGNTYSGFVCRHCGHTVIPQQAGSRHRNHCPHCLHSLHLDSRSGDRLRMCRGLMEPIALWNKPSGELALLHHCLRCGTIKANRVAGDDRLEVMLEQQGR